MARARPRRRGGAAGAAPARPGPAVTAPPDAARAVPGHLARRVLARARPAAATPDTADVRPADRGARPRAVRHPRLARQPGLAAAHALPVADPADGFPLLRVLPSDRSPAP